MDLLARREHSDVELIRKLRKKDHEEADIQRVIQDLIADKLLSNDRFAEAYIHSRILKGYGPLRIRLELNARGITEDLIDHHLKMTDNAWFEHVKKAWQKRFRGALPKDYQKRVRQMRFLQYRGFTSDHIASIFHSDYNDHA